MKLVGKLPVISLGILLFIIYGKIEGKLSMVFGNLAEQFVCYYYEEYTKMYDMKYMFWPSDEILH